MHYNNFIQLTIHPSILPRFHRIIHLSIYFTTYLLQAASLSPGIYASDTTFARLLLHNSFQHACTQNTPLHLLSLPRFHLAARCFTRTNSAVIVPLSTRLDTAVVGLDSFHLNNLSYTHLPFFLLRTSLHRCRLSKRYQRQSTVGKKAKEQQEEQSRENATSW